MDVMKDFIIQLSRRIDGVGAGDGSEVFILQLSEFSAFSLAAKLCLAAWLSKVLSELRFAWAIVALHLACRD